MTGKILVGTRKEKNDLEWENIKQGLNKIK
jgi:hypothetical protein